VIYEKSEDNGGQSCCLSECHPGFAALLHVCKYDSRRQLGLPLLFLGSCRSQLRLTRCVSTHLTGPLLTRVGASKSRERAGVGARLQRQVQQFKNVRINWVDRESLQSKARDAAA
jgi:hypothetical protein